MHVEYKLCPWIKNFFCIQPFKTNQKRMFSTRLPLLPSSLVAVGVLLDDISPWRELRLNRRCRVRCYAHLTNNGIE